MEKKKRKSSKRFVDCWRDYLEGNNLTQYEAVDNFLLYSSTSDVLGELGLTNQYLSAIKFRDIAVDSGYMYEMKLLPNGQQKLKRWMKNYSHPRWNK